MKALLYGTNLSRDLTVSGDWLGRDRCDEHAPSLTLAGAPVGRAVGRAAMSVSHDVYLPVDLVGGLFAEGGIRCPATRTDSLVVWYVVDHFDGFKGRVVPSAMPWTLWLLTTGAFLTCDIVFASSRLD